MRTFVGIVQDVFQVTGPGCIVVHAPPADPGLHVRVGDGVVLRRPDGSEIHAVKLGETMGSRNPDAVPLNLAGVHKADIPIGTEIWLP